MAFRARLRATAACVAAVVAGAIASAARADTFTVTQLGDTGTGSLREAIAAANARPGPDTIVFNAPPVNNFTLLRTALPAISDDLTIIGPNPQYILARDTQIAGVPDFAVISITGSPTVVLRNMTLSQGRGVNGGGISAQGGSLTLEGVTVSNNTATGLGGGVYMRGAAGASLTITGSSVLNNRSFDSGGGVALLVDSGAATLSASNSTISRNSITTKSAGRLGAGLYVSGPGAHALTVTACTIADNAISLAGAGGGVHADSAVGASIGFTNCTVSGNVAGMGAALSVQNVAATLASCTVYANSSTGGDTLGVVRNVGGSVLCRNTILSGNISAGTLRDLAAGQAVSGASNLIGVGGSLANGVDGNIVGVTDPRLVPMGDNGGPTQTFALRPGSPAIDAGSLTGFPAVDQRGQPRPSDGDNDGTARVDIGAFETQRYLVINTNDSGAGSLRDALAQNNTAGGGFVKFAIGALGAVRTIAPAGPLPAVVRTVFVDGWSQGGNAYQGPPLVAISGSAMPAGVGLDIQSNDSTIRGLSIGNFAYTSGETGIGLRVSTRAGVRNWIYGCYIGVGTDGVTPAPNGQAGVWLSPAANTNLIGSNADGVGDAVERNVIGGSTQGVGAGVYVQSNSNVIAGNLIGLGANGSTPVGNATGVAIVSGTSNRIGASTISAVPSAERNVIGNNSAYGVLLSSQGSNNQIAGNSVGIGPDGATAMPNGVGVQLEDVMNSIVGGRVPAVTRNLISGNTLHGVVVRGANALGNSVWGNYIGVASDGRTGLGNGGNGVLITAGASFTRVGSLGDGAPTDADLGNVISGNQGKGVEITAVTSGRLSGDAQPVGAPSSNAVRGNAIGVGADRATSVGNMAAGVSIINSASNIVGSAGAGRNVIGGQVSGSTGMGVEILGSASVLNTVSNNLIGLNAQGAALGNAAGGVLIAQGASDNSVGGIGAGLGNTIANNGGAGVLVRDDATLGNPILGNSVFLNAGLGIDLGGDGVTGNGPALTTRVGPNALQNFPVISGVSSGGQITATLSGKASTSYLVEFFSSAQQDDSLFGEGRTLLGTVTVSTNAAGQSAVFGLGFAPSAGERWVTATATELSGVERVVLDQTLPAGSPLNTSEFSAARFVNTDPVATPQSVTGVEDTDLVITLAGVDPDASDPLSFVVATLPASGQLLQFGSLSPIGAGGAVSDPQRRVVYRPALNAYGSSVASFGFTVGDGLATSAPATVTISVLPVADTPGVTGATTFQSQQTTSGLVVSRSSADGAEVTHFKITGITSGRLFLADGVTEVLNNAFITAAQGAAGLRFTPSDGFVGVASFSVQASLSASDSGIGGGAALAQIQVRARAFTPSVSPTTTPEDTQSTTGLVVSRSSLNGPEVTHYKVAAITRGRVFQADGVTEVLNNAFITAAQGSAGLRFTPEANYSGPASFTVQASVSGDDAGLGGSPAAASITVTPVADTPGVTPTTTTQSQQSSTGLVISRNAADGPEVTHFKVTGVSSGRLFLSDGVTQVLSGGFVTAAQGAAGLRFTPDDRFVGVTTFNVQASLGPTDAGLGGGQAVAQVTVTARAFTPSVTPASTVEDTQSTSGLVIGRNALNGAEVTHYKITAITGGRLYLADGVTEVVGGSFITAAQGAAGLRFTPTPDTFGIGTFLVTASTSASDAGLGGSPVQASITVAPVADTPSITDASTRRNQQTTSGLVVARSAVDGAEVTHFKLVGASSGRVFLADGVTEVPVGGFFTAAQGAAGLRFTPATDFVGSAAVQVRASIGASDSGVGGSVAQATVRVLNVALTPSVTGTTTLEDTQSTSGLVITPGTGDGGVTTHYKITGITSGRLYRADGVTEIVPGSFITAAQGAAGLRFMPAANVFGPASFGVQAASSASDADLGGSVVTAAITVQPVADTPSITGAATFEGGTSGSGLVVTRAGVDGPEVTHFKIRGVSSGTLLLADGVTSVGVGSFITAAQGSAGLRLRPDPGFFGDVTVSVRASLGASDDAVGGSPATARVAVSPVNQPPSFVASNPPATIQAQRWVTIAGWAGGFNPGRSNEGDQRVLEYLVDQVSDPSLFVVAPTVDASGMLSYMTSGSGVGSSTFRVRVRDTGGTANGGRDTSAAQTFTITVRGAVVCRDVTIDARTACVARTVAASQLYVAPSGGVAPSVSFSRPPTQPFPLGTTNVLVTFTYPDGLVSTCTARVTVLSEDCNRNGVPDTCDIASGVESDCNGDGVPDSCQCAWDNGSQDPAQAAQANGQLSHEGGGAGAGVKTLDDFYLRPGSMYRMLSFRGQMLTNVLPVVRKARLELYEGCDGVPASSPFKVFNNSQIVSTVPAVDGFDLVTYTFNLCAEDLWLEGGKTYYVALVGSNNATETDLSFWVTTTPGNNPAKIMGQTPFKRFGAQGGAPGAVVYGPWQSADDCCGGCANMAYSISAEECKIVWDNGRAELTPGLMGGSPSGADGTVLPAPRTADNFVIPPCEDANVCYLEATIFTNCNPVVGFAEVYGNECSSPLTTPLFTARATKVTPLGVSAVVDGVSLPGYVLTFSNPGWTLEAGRTYWLSAGAMASGSATRRSVFGFASGNCADAACRWRISAGRMWRPANSITPWVDTGREYAFRLAVRSPQTVGSPVQATPVCPADFDGDGRRTIEDVFMFLSGWMAGCP